MPIAVLQSRIFHMLPVGAGITTREVAAQLGLSFDAVDDAVWQLLRDGWIRGDGLNSLTPRFSR